MWKFNSKECLRCNINCCEYYNTLDLQEVDIDNILSRGLNLDKHIRVDNKGKVTLRLKKCPFLKDDLCIIHKKYGLRYKPLRCQFYPYNPRIINGKVRVSLFKGCNAVEYGEGENLNWIRKAYTKNYSEYPTLYKLLYGHYLTSTAYFDFSKYFWDNVDVTEESLIAFLSYLMLFSEEKNKILNKDIIKRYFKKEEIRKFADSLRYSKRAKIAKIIIYIHTLIIMKIIGVVSPEKNYKNRMKAMFIKEYILEKAINIPDTYLFTNYIMMLPQLYTVFYLRNKTQNELTAIRIYETQKGFSGFRKKRLINMLVTLLPLMLFILCPKNTEIKN